MDDVEVLKNIEAKHVKVNGCTQTSFLLHIMPIYCLVLYHFGKSKDLEDSVANMGLSNGGEVQVL